MKCAGASLTVTLKGILQRARALDMATSVVAAGKIGVARARNEKIPEGWIIDADGNPSTDPFDLPRGG